MEKKTPLYQTHVDMGGKIVEFGGFLMPVQYPTGVIAEHMAVREKALLSEDRVDWYNLYGDYIYFQKNDSEHPCLGFMRTDGSGYTTLFEGNFKDITITSEYVYFRDFSTDQSYCVPLGSSASPVAFDPGVVED